MGKQYVSGVFPQIKSQAKIKSENTQPQTKWKMGQRGTELRESVAGPLRKATFPCPYNDYVVKSLGLHYINMM